MEGSQRVADELYAVCERLRGPEGQERVQCETRVSTVAAMVEALGTEPDLRGVVVLLNPGMANPIRMHSCICFCRWKELSRHHPTGARRDPTSDRGKNSTNGEAQTLSEKRRPVGCAVEFPSPKANCSKQRGRRKTVSPNKQTPYSIQKRATTRSNRTGVLTDACPGPDPRRENPIVLRAVPNSSHEDSALKLWAESKGMCTRGVWQLERLVVQFCDQSGSSAGIRQWMSGNLRVLAESNQQTVFQAQLHRRRHPLLIAYYRSGESSQTCVKNKGPDEIEHHVQRLRSQSSPRSRPWILGVVTEHPSVQGPWRNEFVTHPPKVTYVAQPMDSEKSSLKECNPII